MNQFYVKSIYTNWNLQMSECVYWSCLINIFLVNEVTIIITGKLKTLNRLLRFLVVSKKKRVPSPI
jgi:hypothetical protein